jgi:3-hydroxybutyryl-CoA dehydrogenase
VYDWNGNKPDVKWLDAVSDSYSPMNTQRRSDGVTEIDELLLIETQGETAQALALRLNSPVVVVDRMEGDVAVIAAAASNPHTATQKAIFWLQQQENGWCKLQITQDCSSGARWR